MTPHDLVPERAATVAGLAEPVDRPKSTVANHEGVLVAPGRYPNDYPTVPGPRWDACR
ncbi:MAG: hypothetical protein M3462_16050 [Chloroflexota bacterium]|nr:hypothetical protein [Chloroflexota bacterium]